MERRWFTNGARTDFAATPADVVQYVHDGWRECDAPADAEQQASDEPVVTPNQTEKDELPNGTTDAS